MAHGKIRNESNCLNCNARVFGPYCHVCGQENRVTGESVWDILVHFFNDITHFEGKFLASIRYLLFSPGRLTIEYIRGRRAAFMNPVRMYIFSSAFFFLIFFLLFDTDKAIVDDDAIAPVPRKQLLQTALEGAKSADDSAVIYKLFGTISDTLTGATQQLGESKLKFDLGNAASYTSVGAYDSAQALLPPEQRDRWLTRISTRRGLAIRDEYHGDVGTFMRTAIDEFFHSFPKILFVTLPLFAWILHLLYIRRRKWFYVDHIIFSIHFFVFTFLWLLLRFSLDQLSNYAAFFGYAPVTAAWTLYMLYYLYKAMRQVYGGSRRKTVFKLFVLACSMLLISIILFTAFFSYTVFTI